MLLGIPPHRGHRTRLDERLSTSQSTRPSFHFHDSATASNAFALRLRPRFQRRGSFLSQRCPKGSWAGSDNDSGGGVPMLGATIRMNQFAEKESIMSTYSIVLIVAAVILIVALVMKKKA